MKVRTFVALTLCIAVLLVAAWQVRKGMPVALATRVPDWPEWARTPQHTGSSSAVGQNTNSLLANITFDPFVSQEQAEEDGELLSHYQAPLVDGKGVFLEVKTGKYKSCKPPGSGKPFPCGPDAWNLEVWNERGFEWQSGSLVAQWNFKSDWKPEPNYGKLGLGGWEPVFHAALWNGFLFVPGGSGSVYKIKEIDGTLITQYAPFGTTDANTYTAGPITVDRDGTIYYDVITFGSSTKPWETEIKGSWLVKITAAGDIQMADYRTFIPNAKKRCGKYPCGYQRPGVNVAPVISADSRTIYVVSRGHIVPTYSFLVAVNTSDLTPVWHSTLHGLDGENDIGYVTDQASSSPVVTPDGGILFGSLGNNYGRGYLHKFNSAGKYQASYDFGWDLTPAIYAHDGTYSIDMKDNNYQSGGPYYITQLNANMQVEWQYKNMTIDQGHPDGYEWCVNAPAVDKNGTVYADSEDGNVYAIQQGGNSVTKFFLQKAVGAAYTPVGLGLDGKIYTLNDGQAFVIGN
jgi:hypothetical protein